MDGEENEDPRRPVSRIESVRIKDGINPERNGQLAVHGTGQLKQKKNEKKSVVWM
jgi:hypothetical protein